MKICDNQCIWVESRIDYGFPQLFYNKIEEITSKVLNEVEYWERSILGDYGYAETIIPLTVEPGIDHGNEQHILYFRKVIKPIVITRPIIKV